MGERRSGCTLFNGLKRWDVGTIEEGDDLMVKEKQKKKKKDQKDREECK